MTNVVDEAKPDNPLAFPLPGMTLQAGMSYPSNPGMRLRDWFAGQALGAILPAPRPPSDLEVDVQLARVAYAIADAMLAERARS